MELDVATFAGSPAELAGALAALHARGFRFPPPRHESCTVLDSFDGRLAGAGLRLERRDGAGRAELVLRGEGVVTAHLPVAGSARFADELPAGPFRSRLERVLAGRALAPQLTVGGLVRRAEWRDRTGKVLAHAVVREALTSEPAPREDGALPAVTIEIEALAGYAKRARQAAAVLEDAGWSALAGDTVATAAEAAGVEFAGFRASPTVPLDPRSPAIEGVRRVLANLAVSVDANWAGTIEGSDPEFLHDLRVAVRRTRSVLAESSDVLPGAIGIEARERFGWLGRATGPARDLDVYVMAWPGYTARLDAATRHALEPASELLRRHRDRARLDLADVLGAPEAAAWMRRWREWLAAPVTDAEQGADQRRLLGEHVVERIARAHRRVIRKGRRIGAESPAELLHDLRKDAKRLRYLLECFGSVLPAKRRDRFVSRLKALQANLGEHQDAEVHVHHVRVISHELHEAGASPATLVAIGQLAEQLDGVRHRARAEFAVQFAAFDSAGTERALDAMLAGVKA